MQNILTYIFLLPIFTALIMLFVSSNQRQTIRGLTLGAIGVQFVLSIYLLIGFNQQYAPDSWDTAFQYVEKVNWIDLTIGSIGHFKVHYFIGVDGISLLLVVLSTLILFIGVLSSWHLSNKPKGYYLLYLILSSSIVGCFIALDFFLFYLCFEFMLLPMFFLIGMWGGKRRSYASIKFFLYTLLGSLFILVAMIMLYMSVSEEGVKTFSITAMLDSLYISQSVLDPNANISVLGIPAREMAFIFLLIGFGIKLPVVPVHTWLPDAHVEAPTSISVVLAGLLLKVGAYGLMRIVFGIFPDIAISYSGLIAAFGVLSILYGGMNALAQRDLKRMVAYSSVSHMGFILIGLSSLTVVGFSGSVFHMISHGLISPGLFILAGVLYDRTNNRTMDCFSGLGAKMPIYTFFVGLFFFAGLGLPGLSGFVGELMVLLGAFSSNYLSIWVGLAAVIGIIISAAYFLWTIQRVFLGKYFVRESSWQDKMQDLSMREKSMLIVLGTLIIALGVFPRFILDVSEYSVQLLVHQFSHPLP